MKTAESKIGIERSLTITHSQSPQAAEDQGSLLAPSLGSDHPGTMVSDQHDNHSVRLPQESKLKTFKHAVSLDPAKQRRGYDETPTRRPTRHQGVM